MKILLTNPPTKLAIDSKREKYFVRAGSRWPHSGIKKKGCRPHYLPFPFFLGYAAALLLKEGFEVKVIDGVAADLSPADEFLQKINELRPDVIFFEVTTPTINYDLDLIRTIKKQLPESIIAVGGSHITTFARQFLNKCSEIDFALLGEYELTLLELVKKLAARQEPDIPGLAWRQKETIKLNQFRPLIEPLDILPPPARELFPLSDKPNPTVYWDGFCQYYPALQMQASRGCPYGCYFCLWPQVMYRSRKYRHFSVKRVVDEMEMLVKKYGAKEIYFDDDDFTIDRNFVRQICEEILSRNLKVKWSVMGDAINLDEDLIELMVQAGLVGIKYGIESASPDILLNMGKPVNLKKAREVTRILKKFGVKTHATFTLGLIGETKKTIAETLDFARQLDCDTIQVSIATPFPGTKFFTIAESNHWLKEFRWEDFDGKTKEIMELPTISGEELQYQRKNFARRWLLSKILKPGWLLRQIKFIFRAIRAQGLSFYWTKIKAALVNELGL